MTATKATGPLVVLESSFKIIPGKERFSGLSGQGGAAGHETEIPRRAKSVSMKTTTEELAPYMRGWRSYFGFCETPRSVVVTYSLGPTATQSCHVAAVENTAPSPGVLLELGVRTRLASNTAGSGLGP
jgi:hypothetical protein